MWFKDFLVDWFTGVYDKAILHEKMWGRDYGHPQRSFYTVELIDKLEKLISIDQRLGRPCFLSVNYYKGNIGKPGKPVAIEKLFFDLDYPENIEKAREDARKLVDKLLAYCKPLLVFSGGKGYHVYCYIETPIEGTKQFLKTVLDTLLNRLGIPRLNLVSLDERVVGDVSRLSRIPYTRHDKTKRLVVPLDYDFRSIDIESFSLNYYISNSLSKKLAREIVNNISMVESIETVGRKYKKKKITWLKMFEDEKLFNEIFLEGKTFDEDPKEIAKQLALYFRNIEMKNRHECMKSLIEWCKRTQVLDTREVEEIAFKYCR